MTLSGPNACRGSIKEVRIFPVFLHSPGQEQSSVSLISPLNSTQLPIAGKVDGRGRGAYCSKTKGVDCVSREAYWLLGEDDSKCQVKGPARKTSGLVVIEGLVEDEMAKVEGVREERERVRRPEVGLMADQLTADRSEHHPVISSSMQLVEYSRLFYVQS